MLVLSRKPGEEIVIGGNIRVFVLSVEGSKVRLGIEAPRSIGVDRKEVFVQRRMGMFDEATPLSASN